jgi:spore coat protein A
MLLRRSLTAAGSAALLLTAGTALGAQSPQVPLPGKSIPQFAQPLPVLNLSGVLGAQAGGNLVTALGNKPLAIKMCEFQSAILPPGTPVAATVAPPAGKPPLTWTWGYLIDPNPLGTTPCADLVALYTNTVTGVIDSYLGPVLVNARNGGSTDITWVNDLKTGATTNVLAWKYSTDQTLHWADPLAPQLDDVANACMMNTEMASYGGFTYPPFGHACARNYEGPIPAVPHVHGGEQPAEIDGSPDSWFTSDGLKFGHKYYSAPGAPRGNTAIYKYPNDMEAAPIWFHDHALGVTRLNVYAGMAGAYYIYDPARIAPDAVGVIKGTCQANCLPKNLQPLESVVPLVLQDRMFDTNGELFFTADSAGGLLWALNPEHPYWNPEFVGDTIVVNGKAWPFHNVSRQRYRFLFINGSNARTYEMFLVDPVTKAMGPPMWVIGTDGGYLDAPVKIDPNATAKGAQTKLVIQPGERYEVIIDFAALPAGSSGSLVLKNTGRTPYPKGAAPTGTTLGQVMKFVVSAGAVADASYNPATDGPLRTGTSTVQRLVNPATGVIAVTPAKTRQLTLNEVMGMPINAIDPVTNVLTAYPGGPLEILVNNTKWSGLVGGMTHRPDFTSSAIPVPPPPATQVGTYTTDFSEMPQEGDTEVWEIVNLTADAHPIHLHAVQFQILNRQSFNVNTYGAAYAAAFTGGPLPLPTGPMGCTAGFYCPGYGPPLAYGPSVASGGKLGGNPDVTPFLQGPIQPPLASEAGWKDTALNMPGMVTRYAVRWAPNSLPANTPASQSYFRFDPSGGGSFAANGTPILGKYNYVWHCHIIDHEDNEMMRPDSITLNPLAPAPAVRPLVRGINY